MVGGHSVLEAKLTGWRLSRDVHFGRGLLSKWVPYMLSSMRTLLCFVISAISAFGQDRTPKKIVAISDYVPLAQSARISGDVQVKCLIDADGSVLRAEVLSGHPLLREQARKNALLWKFQRTGPQESNTVTLHYQYRLEGELQDQARTGAHTVFFVDLPNKIYIIAPIAWVNP